MKSSIKSICIFLATLVLLTGCGKKSSEKKILSFRFAGALDEQVTITENPKAVVAIVKYGTNLTSLVPIITISDDATISPASGIETDFSQPVVYTVTAEDGSQARYTATVTVNQNDGEEEGEPTPLSGNINVNKVLPNLGLKVDYVVDGPITLTDNALLTVEPGVTIMFTNEYGGIEVGQDAALHMVGTPEKPIVLKGSSDLSHGTWGRVLIHSDREENQFEYVRFMHGGNGANDWDGVVNVRGKLSMKHCSIDGSLNCGLSTEEDGYLTAFEDNLITHCGMNPWYTDNFPSLCSNISADNRFVDNADNRVYVGFSYFELDNDVTLTALPIPYYFPDGFSFGGTKTITLAAGVSIEMASQQNFLIGDECCFIARGTSEKPIIFRSSEGGEWGSLVISSTRSRNLMEYCQIKNGGASTGWESCNLYIRSDAKLTLHNNTFGPTQYYGVGIEYIENFEKNVEHSDNTFTGCAGGNVFVERGGTCNGTDYDDNSVIPNLP